MGWKECMVQNAMEVQNKQFWTEIAVFLSKEEALALNF